METGKVVTLDKMIHRLKSENVTFKIELTEDFYGSNIKTLYYSYTITEEDLNKLKTLYLFKRYPQFFIRAVLIKNLYKLLWED